VAAPKLVVYVEDNPANFALVCKLLEVTGNYEVLRAEDGETGLTLIKERHPDVVLLDLDLPGITGIEVARRLKGDASTASIPILVVTASVMKREYNSALEAGADVFIEKPFDIAQLRALVDQACGLAPKSPAGDD
jgi:CheY-like chemotaxis protein